MRLFKQFYSHMRPVWLDLNLGKLSEQEAVVRYQQQFNISHAQVDQFMQMLKTSQTPIPGSLELLERLWAAGIALHSIT